MSRAHAVHQRTITARFRNYRADRFSTPPAFGVSDMAVVFTVVGEHRDDPDRLLVIGDDGITSELSLPTGQLIPVEPTGDEWTVTPPVPTFDDQLLGFDAY